MRTSRRLARLGLAALALALALLPLTGCFKLALMPTQPEHVLPFRAIPCPARQHVCVVLVDTFDPLESGQLAGLRNYLNRMGFPTTIYGQCYHLDYLFNKMCHVYHNAPATRFVVIGQGCSQELLPHLFRPDQPVPIELTILLDKHDPCGETEYAGSPEHARVLRVGPLSQPENLNRVIWELQTTAARVPIQFVAAERVAIPDGVELPLPRPVAPGTLVPPGALAPPAPLAVDPSWNALDPAGHLQAPPEVPLPAPRPAPAVSPFAMPSR